MAEKLGLPLAGGKEPGEDSERRGVSEAWVLTGCEGAEGKRCGRKCAEYGDPNAASSSAERGRSGAGGACGGRCSVLRHAEQWHA